MNYITIKTRDKAHLKIEKRDRWRNSVETYRSRILDCASGKDVFLKVFSPKVVDKLQRLVHMMAL